MPNMMLKTPEEKRDSKVTLFQKPRKIVRNCQPQQDERRCNLHDKEAEKKKNRNKESDRKRERGGIRKVFKKTEDVIIAEPKITTVTGWGRELPIQKIKSVIERARVRNSSGKKKKRTRNRKRD